MTKVLNMTKILNVTKLPMMTYWMIRCGKQKKLSSDKLTQATN